MNIDIQSFGHPTADTLSDHAKRRLRFVLAHHGDSIVRVSMRLGDCKGQRGGADKFCRVQVYLLNAPVAVIHDTGSDAYDVIDHAIDRAGWMVAQHLESSHMFVRHAQAGTELGPPDGASADSRARQPEAAVG